MLTEDWSCEIRILLHVCVFIAAILLTFFIAPFVDPRYGSSDEDNAEIVNCIETVREIMAKSDPKFVGEELEPSRSAKTKEQLTQYVRNGVWGMFDFQVGLFNPMHRAPCI